MQVAEARDKMMLASCSAMLHDKDSSVEHLKRAASILIEAAANLNRAAKSMGKQHVEIRPKRHDEDSVHPEHDLVHGDGDSLR